MKRALIATLLVAGCYTGPPAQRYPPAQEPRGIAADLRLPRRVRIRGELLAIQDTALFLLSDQRVVLVPLRQITAAAFRRHDAVIGGGRITARDREALRMVSRFPHGLSGDVLSRLLAAHGQTAPDTR